jgi:CRP/FNR family cyclic AMP-dependent transcriptional regulator
VENAPYASTSLPAVALFEGLTSAEREELAALARPAHVRAGASLMIAGQPGEVVYLVLKGTLRAQVEQEDGTLVLLAFLGPGDTVGEMSLFDNDVRSASVVALEDCSVIWMDRAAFRRCLDKMPRLGVNLLFVMCRRLRLADERIQSLSTLDVAGRVSRQLAALAISYGEPAADGSARIVLRLTQGDIADLVGASRERVNQVMGGMRRRGLISVDSRHRIAVHDPNALARRYA